MIGAVRRASHLLFALVLFVFVCGSVVNTENYNRKTQQKLLLLFGLVIMVTSTKPTANYTAVMHFSTSSYS